MTATLTFIVGCTACGKGSLGRELARRAGGEIISVDSMKVYRRMDIGTAKPSREVRGEVTHHVIDVVEPSEEFSVAQFVGLADEAVQRIHARGKPIFAVGGTPLYVKGLTEGLFEGPGADPDLRARLRLIAEQDGSTALFDRLEQVDPRSATRIHPNDLRRIIRALEVFELTGKTISALQTQWDMDRTRYDCVLIGLRRELTDQSHRTNERVRRMIALGFVDEVRELLAETQPLSPTASKALGYAEMIEHLEGRASLADAIEMIKIHTRQFAKSQRTWFKRFREIEWLELAADTTASEVADGLMQRRGSLWSA